MKLTTVAISTLEAVNTPSYGQPSPVGKVKYFHNMVLAGWHMDINSAGLSPNFKSRIEKKPALEDQGHLYFLDMITDSLMTDELRRLAPNQTHNVFYNSVEHEGSCGMGPSTFSYSFSLEKHLGNHSSLTTSVPRTIFVSSNGKTYLVGAQITLEPTPAAYKAIQPAIEQAVAAETQRATSIWQSKIVKFQQLQKTIADSEAELKAMKAEFGSQGMSI